MFGALGLVDLHCRLGVHRQLPAHGPPRRRQGPVVPLHRVRTGHRGVRLHHHPTGRPLCGRLQPSSKREISPWISNRLTSSRPKSRCSCRPHAASPATGRLSRCETSRPATLFFSDRPQRVVGHMTTADFVGLWGEGDNSFEADPPNAVLSFVEPGAGAPPTPSSSSRNRRSSNGQLSYSIDVLEGTVPIEAGPVTLFIDPFGRPLSPVSVCGVRRRERRRDRR